MGGIYVVEGAVDADGAPKTRSALRGFNVEDMGIDVGSTTLVNQSTRNLAAPNALLADNDPFQKAGKVGIGGIAIDATERILYMVNLFDKRVYAIDISNPTDPSLIGSVATPAGTNQQAFALTLHQGQLYVGYNDTGSAPFQAAGSGMHYYVDRVPALEASETSFGVWEKVLNNGNLGYAKGNPTADWGGNPAGSNPQFLRWNTWTDSWTGFGGNSVSKSSGWGNVHVYPQPLLSGLTFDREGFMTLGFMDRTQLQSGNQNCAASGACNAQNGPLHQTLASGDILLAAPQLSADGASIASWTPENNGSASGTAAASVSRSTANGGSNEGPGNREFFNDRQWFGNVPGNSQGQMTNNNGNHREIALGGVVVVPGTSNQVASNAYDPLAPVRVVGIQWFNLQNGDRARGYQHTWDPGDPAFNNARPSFQKGGGMGGLALLSKAAPVEIGNRAWLDLNGDGIQDAGEPSIQNAIVELWRADADGNPTTQVGAAKTTDENGNYFFRSENASTGATPGFTPEGDYVVVFKPGTTAPVLNWHGGSAPAGFPATLAWSQLAFTDPEVVDPAIPAGATDEERAELAAQRDSNAVPSGPESNPNARANAPVSVGHFGQNDHSIDAGWKLGTVTVGDYVWEDSVRNGIQDAGEPGIEGVLLKIYLVDGGDEVELTADIFGVPFAQNRTDEDGLYLFENLPVLTGAQYYKVVIATDDDQTTTALTPFAPTEANASGSDRGNNSNTDFATTQDASGDEVLNVPGREDRTLDFGFIRLQPSATILKGDRDPSGTGYRSADTADDAVDLTTTGSASGTTDLVFWIENNGDEPLYEIVVTDDVTVGNASVDNMRCDFPGLDSATDGEKDTDSGQWTVTWAESFGAADQRETLPVDAGFKCFATLNGVIGDHINWANVTAKGSSTDTPVEPKEFTPGTPGDPEDPENPGTPTVPGTENPFHAKRTPAVSVGDRVWWDTIPNGLQDRDEDTDEYLEAGIDGVVLEIVGPDGQAVKSVVTGQDVPTTTTAGGGFYEFIDLPVLPEGQSYTVKIVTPPTGFKPTLVVNDGEGEDDSSDGEAASQLPLQTHGADDPTLDFGFVKLEPTAEIIKTDGNGADANTEDEAVDVGPADGTTAIRFQILNDGEEPLTNIQLTDVSAGGTLSAIECTAPGGATFGPATPWSGTLSNVAGDDADNPQNVITCVATLTGVAAGITHNNVVTMNADGALSGEPIDPPTDEFWAKYKTYAIGDYVWIDANNDGVQNDDELPFAGGTGVRLFKITEGEGGAPVRTAAGTTSTDANGYYLFDELPAGNYEIEFQLPSGYLWTVNPATGDDADETNDSNAIWTAEDQEWAATVGITLGDSNTALDTAYALQEDWAATEGLDPTWDAGIVKRVPNATIDKSDDEGETANDGGEVVDLGADGATTIVFTIENTGAEPLTNIGLADVTTSGSGELQYPIVLTLPNGDEYELDGADARWDGELARGATLVGTAQLTGVTVGQTHRNVVTLHAEGALTGDPVGTPEDPESPNVPPTDEFNGRVPSFAIGDYVWIDANRDGIQDAGEQPYAGMTVRLIGADDEPVLDADGNEVTDTTDANGHYLFDNLVEGSYRVVFELPNEYRWTTPNSSEDGANATNNSDAVSASSDDAEAGTGWITLGASSPLTSLGEQDGRPFTATEGIDQTWDAGIVLRTYAIGDVVWIDRNEDGEQATDEPRIEGVAVNLLNGDGEPVMGPVFDENGNPVLDEDDNPVTAARTTTTDANGLYKFDELPAGTYIVEFVLPDGYRWTEANADEVSNDDNSDAQHDTPTQATARTGVITLGNVQVTTGYDAQTVTATEGIDPTWDAGVVPLKVSVGDYVWHDKDGDGVQNDGDDSGINGVTLSLTVKRADGTEEPVTNVWGEQVQPVTTNDDDDDKPGYYEFKDLPILGEGESYIVTISNVPAEYKPTITDESNGEGADDSSTDSTASVLDLTTDGANDPTLDFGFVLKTPSGTVNKSDEDENDANTADEAVDLGPAAGEVTIVFTIENDGEEPLTNIGLVDVTSSGSSGLLQYPILVTTSEGQSFEIEDADYRWDGELAVGEIATGTAILSGVTAGQSHENIVTLWADGSLTGKPVEDPSQPPSEDPENPNRPEDPYNAKFLTYALGDVVWVDRDQNGQQDAGEPRLADVTVNLLDGEGNPIAGKTTTTNAEGLYAFSDLPAGEYIVEFVLPDGYRWTEANAEGVLAESNSDAVHADPEQATARTGVITLGNGSVTKQYDAQPWSGTEGIDPSWDAGVVPASVSVGDRAWQDTNPNGLQDVDDEGNYTEPGIEGVTLTITGPEGWDGKNVYGETVEPIMTDDRGFYEFKDLPVLEDGQNYTVTISDVPAKFKPTTEGENGGENADDSSTDSATSVVPLTEHGANDPTLDFGFVLTSPGATVNKSDDQGRDGNDDHVDISSTQGEIGIHFRVTNNGDDREAITNIGLVDGTTVGSGSVAYPLECAVEGTDIAFELADADARWDGTLAHGQSIFCEGTLSGVVAGEPHTNVVTLFAEGALSGNPVLTPEDPDEPVGPNNPLVPPSDEYNAKVKTYAIGDRVWNDITPNGIQDVDDEGNYTEPGIAGVTVILFDKDGNQVGDPVTTGDDGYYQFDNLEPGEYRVTFDLPAGYILVDENEGDDVTVDSDAVATNPQRTSGSTVLVTLDDTNTQLSERDSVTATEGIDPTWDAGVRKYTFAIGDVVWIDRIENGRQDAGEPPIADVTVNLYRAGENGELIGDPIATDITDADGRYLFDELIAGDYVVEFVLPNGYRFTEQNAAGVPAGANSDADTVTGRTGVITLGNGSVTKAYEDQTFTASEGIDPTWDAGVIPLKVSVGDFVWHDTTPNGIQGSDEPGIPEVTLTLTGPDGEPVTNVYGEPVGPVQTDGTGFYEFIDLPALEEGESYTVTISNVPDRFKPTTVGENNGQGADDSSTGSATSVIDLTTDGANDPTLDFGFVLKTPGAEVNKSDAAGNDANTPDVAIDLGPTAGATSIVFTIENNGDEPLTNIGLVDATTSGGGDVQYPIVLTLPDGSTFELRDAEARWDGVLEIGDTITGTAQLSGVPVGQQSHTNVVTLHAEGALTGKPVEDPNNPSDDPENPNRPHDPYNAEHLSYAIGDVVWVDRNKNGQQDGDEAPIADVTVNLYDANGALIGSTETDEQGLYLFDNLVAGDYTVEFELPAGYTFTEQNAAGVPAGGNSDADVNTGRTGTITLGNGSVTKDYTAQEFEATEGIDPTWDAGVIPQSVSVGDFVWFDLNRDGVQDPGEPGIAEGTTLTITGPNGPVTNVYGEPVGPVETDASGFYEFTDLPVLGDGEFYTVTISNVPDRFKPTEEGAGNDPARDSSTGSAVSGPLTRDGANDPTLDFGFVLQVPGATVVKSDADGNDANSADDAVDLSDSYGSTEILFTIVNDGEEPLTNIGLVDVSTGSGSIEYPISVTTSAGQSFTLPDAEARWDGELAIGETATGTARLTGVAAGEPHQNVVTLWADGVLTGNPVEDPENPSDDPEKPNRPEDPYNAVVKSYAIGDYVWIDQLNPNGTQDGDEPGLGGVTVRLLDADGSVLATTETGSDGYYQFDNLERGTYQVQFELPHGYVFIAPDQGGDDTIDSDALPIAGTNGTQGRTILVVLDDSNTQLTPRDGVSATEGIDPTWDAGVRLAEVSVGDKVWKDRNRDGIQDPGEPGIPGVVLVIERSDGQPVTDVNGNPVGPVTTDENGEYRFDRLPLLPSDVNYVVKIDRDASRDPLGNLVPTTPGAGDDPSRDSSDWEETARGLNNDGDEDPTLDFGFVEPSVTVGDRVWEDRNRNGVQDSGEPGIPGVVLEIVGPDGKPVTDVYGDPVGPVTTDENGNYLFPNLPALPEDQSYTVRIDREASAEVLAPFVPTLPGAGDDPARDSSDWEADTTGLTSNGDEDLTLDFGFIRPSVSIGDKVWKDIDRDGRQGAGEPGIPGIVLVVTDRDGNPVKDVYGNPVLPVTTDSNGDYLFTDLPTLPGDDYYVVSIDREASQGALGNLIPTVSGEGDREGDSSDWTERSEGLNNDGEQDLTLDFGFVVPKVSVGDRVWFDTDGDGRQGGGEPGIKGVVLEIVGPDGKPVTDVYGNIVGPVTTDENGNYLFENLPALEEGERYTVTINVSASGPALDGLVPTVPGVGDRESDSSTGSASSEGLNADGDQDLTLDFGFVLVTPDTPVPPSVIVNTGSGLLLPLGLGGLTLLLLGAGTVLVARKRSEQAA